MKNLLPIKNENIPLYYCWSCREKFSENINVLDGYQIAFLQKIIKFLRLKDNNQSFFSDDPTLLVAN